MPWSNLTGAVTNANRDAILGFMTSAEGVLSFLISMTNDERRTLSKMGPDGLNYVTKCIEYAEANPTMIPAGVSVAMAREDLDRHNQLRIVWQDVQTTLRKFSDTMIASGIEAKDFADLYYSLVKGMSKTNFPGAQAIFDDLKPFYDKASQEDETLEPVEP